jgi:hypothetical protein
MRSTATACGPQYPARPFCVSGPAAQRVQIREFMGFREATVQDGHELVVWSVARVLPIEHREDHVREAVFDRCRAQHIEPPSAGRVDRLVRSGIHIFEEHWCASVFEQLGAATQLALDDLIATGSCR